MYDAASMYVWYIMLRECLIDPDLSQYTEMPTFDET